MPHTHGAAGQSVVLLALLWAPLFLFLLNRSLSATDRWRSIPRHTRAALFLMLISAITHAALIPDHASDPVRRGLFGLDAVALTSVFLFALLRVPGWALMARLLLASAVGAYVYYVRVGWESIDLVGLSTKVVEMLAIALLWLPDDPEWAFVRIQSRR